MTQVHVQYSKKLKEWQVRILGVINGGGRLTYSGFATQREAWGHGRAKAKERHAELLIHTKATGRIRVKDSFGNDPRGRKG